MRWLRNRSLTLVLMILFFGSWAGQILTGLRDYNEDQQEHHQPPISLREYLATGHFWEATAENWESEFLQMAAFVVLAAFLYQKGSPESKDPDSENAVDSDPRLARNNPRAPWPVRRGGWALRIYSHSLSICFVLLFLLSFAGHAAAGAREYNQDQREHGEPPVSTVQFLATSKFWFQSFQNWQSEFLSIAAMVYLSVYLRQRGSPESKPVATPHDESGEEEPVRVPVPVPASAR